MMSDPYTRASIVSLLPRDGKERYCNKLRCDARRFWHRNAGRTAIDRDNGDFGSARTIETRRRNQVNVWRSFTRNAHTHTTYGARRTWPNNNNNTTIIITILLSFGRCAHAGRRTHSVRTRANTEVSLTKKMHAAVSCG